jgi:hypothetical protein
VAGSCKHGDESSDSGVSLSILVQASSHLYTIDLTSDSILTV